MRILYLEDSPSDIDLMRRYVKSIKGSEAFFVEREAAAVEHLEVSHPDIFLVDVMINGVPVHDLIKRALDEHLAEHVVLVTAKVLPSELKYYRSLGCQHVIAKPFTVDDLDRVFTQIA